MNNKVIVGILIILALGLAYFAISPLFKNVAVDDALPENLVTESENISDVPSGFEDLSPAEQEEMLEQMEVVNETPLPPIEDSMPEKVITEEETKE